jgi:hypothetical protein
MQVEACSTSLHPPGRAGPRAACSVGALPYSSVAQHRAHMHQLFAFRALPAASSFVPCMFLVVYIEMHYYPVLALISLALDREREPDRKEVQKETRTQIDVEVG